MNGVDQVREPDVFPGIDFTGQYGVATLFIPLKEGTVQGRTGSSSLEASFFTAMAKNLILEEAEVPKFSGETTYKDLYRE